MQQNTAIEQTMDSENPPSYEELAMQDQINCPPTYEEAKMQEQNNLQTAAKQHPPTYEELFGNEL